MNKIETYDDLLKEELALQSSLAIQKHVIQKEIMEIREHFEPLRKTVSFLSKFFTRDNTSALVGTGIGILGDIVFKNVILAKSGWLTRMVLPYLVKNYSSHVINDKPGILQNIVQKLKSGLRSKETKIA
jgi:hypothetical protein